MAQSARGIAALTGVRPNQACGIQPARRFKAGVRPIVLKDRRQLIGVAASADKVRTRRAVCRDPVGSVPVRVYALDREAWVSADGIRNLVSAVAAARPHGAITRRRTFSQPTFTRGRETGGSAIRARVGQPSEPGAWFDRPAQLACVAPLLRRSHRR